MIYKNIHDAREAQHKFHEEYEALLEKYGASFWENDDCAGSGYSFQYRDNKGNVQTLE